MHRDFSDEKFQRRCHLDDRGSKETMMKRHMSVLSAEEVSGHRPRDKWLENVLKRGNICFNVASDLLKVDKLACGYY